MRTDDVTFIVWIGFLPIWFVVELLLLKRRKDRKPGESIVKTISQVARQRGWQLSSVVFFWTSMPVHWWLPVPWEATTASSVVFWSIQAVLLVWNIVTWRKWTKRPLDEWPQWLIWVNWPVWYMALGVITAAFLFPQSNVVPWRM